MAENMILYFQPFFLPPNINLIRNYGFGRKQLYRKTFAFKVFYNFVYVKVFGTAVVIITVFAKMFFDFYSFVYLFNLLSGGFYTLIKLGFMKCLIFLFFDTVHFFTSKFLWLFKCEFNKIK